MVDTEPAKYSCFLNEEGLIAVAEQTDIMVFKGYAPAGSFRSLILLLSVIAIICGVAVFFNQNVRSWWWSLGPSISGLIVFTIAAASVDRVTINLTSNTYSRRKGIAGWFRAPATGKLADLRGIGLGRRKLSQSSSVSWAPVLVWPDSEIHVLTVGSPHDFPHAGQEIRRIGEVSGLSLLDTSEEMKCDWHIVPIAQADRAPTFRNLVSRTSHAETNEADS